jgi:predicted Fe-Mo cluster-binding NifX family protein
MPPNAAEVRRIFKPNERTKIMSSAKTNTTEVVRIGIPVQEERLHGHFGGSREFAVVEVDLQAKTVLKRRTVAAPPHKPGSFPLWLKQEGVQVVIAAGIGRPALELFRRHGIAVKAGPAATALDVLLASFLGGRLSSSPAPCEHAHHEGGEAHEHCAEHAGGQD